MSQAIGNLGLPRPFALAARPTLYPGNRVELLINGEQYFPALLRAIEGARNAILLETYIFEPDAIGHRVAAALGDAAARGVQVRVLIDGYGGGDYARRLVDQLGACGAEVRIYRPERWWRLERKLLRRLHRKIVVVDDAVAFVGGINILDDLRHPGGRPTGLAPRFDFAVACEGPIVAAIAVAARQLWWALTLVKLRDRAGKRPQIESQPRPAPFSDGVQAAVLLRDNFRNRRTIERAYLDEIAGAREEILIACAYFLPGRRFRAALRDAVARGVRVRLLLQGRLEYWIQHHAQRALYGQLLDAGLEIHEYLPSYLHAKVAVIDGKWSTVGSSNIDPYSLLLAREANIVVRDARFAGQLTAVLEQAVADGSYLVKSEDYARRGWFTRVMNWFAYGVVRLATVVLARGRNY